MIEMLFTRVLQDASEFCRGRSLDSHLVTKISGRVMTTDTYSSYCKTQPSKFQSDVAAELKLGQTLIIVTVCVCLIWIHGVLA